MCCRRQENSGRICSEVFHTAACWSCRLRGRVFSCFLCRISRFLFCCCNLFFESVLFSTHRVSHVPTHVRICLHLPAARQPGTDPSSNCWDRLMKAWAAWLLPDGRPGGRILFRKGFS